MSNIVDNTKVSKLIEQARQKVAATINIAMVYTYFDIGKMIVKEEQLGNTKAEYNKQLIESLSKKLIEQFGKGFSATNLKQMRQFYLAYCNNNRIGQMSSDEFDNSDNNQIKQNYFTLNWSHYLILMRIDNIEERKFYEIEATSQHWSEAELRRQYNSSLYERLALSRDKQAVMDLSKKVQRIQQSKDIFKKTLVLEFLGLEENIKYSENDLENAIISKLQKFLLELGKGFLFEARQKRFSFDEKNFYVDLVFYNRLLKCYVLIDLKIDELTHQNLGQMLMYVNYYDRCIKLSEENPTIGIVLCKNKSHTLVELTLPKDSNIYASAYDLYLPDKKLLQNKLKEWIEEFENQDVVEEVDDE